MNCPACAHENRPAAKFCEECATPLKHACASCGVELRPAAKFCDECGTRVAGAPAARGPASPAPEAPVAVTRDGARKIVTIVFADLVGSTALHERLDPESARRFMESYYAAARAAVEGHGGTVTQLLGDGVKAVFGIPRVAEDDALRAVQAAVAMQEAFRALAAEQRGAVGATGLRVAVNTGEVVAKDETEIIGDPVNVAARLQEQGRDGDVVVGESTHRLVEMRVTLELLGSFALKGRAEAVQAYRVVALDAPAGATTAAFVGREEELARIGTVYERAVATPATRLVVLGGSPGVGKSRLIDEFTRRSAEVATVVTARCDAAGGATFAPLAAALRAHFGIEADASTDAIAASIAAALPGDDAERTRVANGVAALLGGSPAAPEETFFVVRRVFARLTTARPIVLVIDDLQWAEPLFLDLVEHLVEWGSDVPLLVLVGARPELRDVRPPLVMPGGLVADVVTLGGLDAGAATRLAANVVGAADLPAAVAAKVLATSEGNPLFISELVRMLVHEGALTREGGRWIIGTALATLEMPPTIHALLAARIERLPPEERAVLERAAVVGRQFSRSAVAELLPRNGSELDGWLQALQRSELIERDTGWLLGEPVLRFHHTLIRDAAYRRILKDTRAQLHARLADWMEARAGDASEHDETIGRHLEQAHQLLGELGPLDAAGRILGERASKRLAAAGRAALGRDDVPLAANLLGRALDRLASDDPARAELALDWCEALLAGGDVGPAADAIDELARFTHDSERLRAWHTCFAGQHSVLTAPEALDETAAAVAAAATTLAGLDDAAGEAKAHFVHALALARLGKVGACEEALDKALAAARRAGDRRRANTVLAVAPLAALWGPSPVTRASGRCLDVVRVLRITQGAPAVEAVALSCQGVLEALRGRSDAARRMIASARTMVEELGITQRLLEADAFAGLVALLEGDAPAAERALRGAYDGLRELGLGIDAAQAAALLARALLAQDRAAEAETLSHESEALAGDDLKAAIAWRGVRAEALARRGEHATAVELATRAVEIAAATDALLDHADARLALAAALRAAGRDNEAAAEERRAHELWETKGATLLGGESGREGASVDTTGVAPPSPGAGASVGRGAAERRVQPNAATALQARVERMLEIRDFAAIRASFADDHWEIDHATGSEYGPDECIASLERLYRSRDPSYHVDPIATLGPALLLARRRSGASGASGARYDVGTYEDEKLQILEIDERGLFRRSEVFGEDHLGDAVARLYERYAELLPDGPARERAVMTARVVTAEMTGMQLDRLEEIIVPDLLITDYRFGHAPSQGTDHPERLRAAYDELTEDRTIRVDDVLGLSPDAVLRQSTMSGTARASGGRFETSYLVLSAFAADGREKHVDIFDPKYAAEALARFDELAAGAAAPAAASGVNARGAPSATATRFANAATRLLIGRMNACMRARDWTGFARCLAPDVRLSDRRRLARLELGRDEMVEMTRALGDMPTASLVLTPLATRGERLALCHGRAQVAGDDVGPSEVAHLNVFEMDEEGNVVVANVRFDTDDVAAAQAELDARYAAGEARAHPRAAAWLARYRKAFAARDLGALAALFAPDLVAENHRLVGWGTRHGPDGVVSTMRAQFELAPDTTARIDHVRLCERGLILEYAWYGTRDGGPFENLWIDVFELDEHGRVCRGDVWEPGQYDQACARFAEIEAGGAARTTSDARPAARAARARHVGRDGGARTHSVAVVGKRPAEGAALARIQDLFNARDWEGVAALAAPDMRWDDRRRLFQLSGGKDLFLASLRERAVAGATGEFRELGSAGERVVIARILYAGGPRGGRFEIEALVVAEIDEVGRLAGTTLFDPEDADAARHEAWARWAAIDAMAPPLVGWVSRAEEVFNAHDRERIGGAFTDDLVVEDHRRAGLGRLEGAAAYAQSLAVLWELSADTQIELGWFWPAAARNGAVINVHRFGTVPDGGPFESDHLMLFMLDGERVRHQEMFELDALDAALARFAELTAGATPRPQVTFRADATSQAEATPGPVPASDPLAALARLNLATAVLERWEAAFDTGAARDDWEPMRRLCAPGMVFEDRRRLALLEGDRELMIASARERVHTGARPTLTLRGMAGDRVAVAQLLWAGGPVDGRFEIEYYALMEVDAAGLITTILLIDIDEPRVALREAWARWAGVDPVAAPWVELFTSQDWDAGDLRLDPDVYRAIYAEDLVVVDHRRTGFGRLEGLDAWIEAVSVLRDLAPDTRVEVGWYWPACDRHAALVSLRRTGTVPDGGPYESDYLVLQVRGPGGLIARNEMFEIDQLDAALARFEELRPPGPAAAES